jgi:uncharacterized protein YdhG (YjbR/CyaY superfamily)
MQPTTKKNTTIDEYLNNQNTEDKEVMQQLREFIHKQAPQAEESISYSMPAFKYHGLLVAFLACKNHYGFYPCAGSTVEKFKDELKGFETTKGSIHFTKEKPIPLQLLKKIIKERMKENEIKESVKVRK